MAHEVPYSEKTLLVDDALVAGNSTDANPTRVTIQPANGPDYAQLRSMMFALETLQKPGGWTAQMQKAMEDAFTHGQRVFAAVVLSIENYSIPAIMAHRVGLVKERPTTEAARKQQIPITTGIEYSKIAGIVTSMSAWIGGHVCVLTGEVQAVDARLFAQPSGSGKMGTSATPHGTAPSAQKVNDERATAGKRTRKRVKRRATTSSASQ